MSYLSEVLADSPAVYAPLDVYSSGFADSSGNTRDLNVISGTAPSATAGSPFGAPDAGEWGASAGHVRTTYTQTSPGAGTYEFWLYFASNPAAAVTLAAWSPNSGSNGTTTYMQLLTSGKVRLTRWAGAFVHLDTASALSTGVWHHVVGTWGSGAGTNRVRVDKATDVSGAAGGATGIANSSFRLHGHYDGASNIAQTGAVKMAHAAFYASPLSDARTDAHFDAAFTVAGERWISAATMLDGSALTAISVSGDPFACAATMLDGSVTAAPIVVDGEVFAGAAVALDGLPLTAISVAGDPFGLIATMLDGSAVLGPVAGQAFVTAVVMLNGGVLLPVGTDTSNAFYGRHRGGTATVELTVPVVEPIGVATTRIDKAVPLPLPVLVKGRPT